MALVFLVFVLLVVLVAVFLVLVGVALVLVELALVLVAALVLAVFMLGSGVCWWCSLLALLVLVLIRIYFIPAVE